jgi:penicillin-binding protein 1C
MDTGAAGAYQPSARGQNDLKSTARARITAPASGTIIALDPDIPPARQRLHFTATGGSAVHWRMDGKPLGRGPGVAWLPWPGRHVVQLTDAKGTVLDEIRFEVRGAGVAAAR